MPFALDWVRHHVEPGADVTATYDERSPVYPNGHATARPAFRYQIQGPQAGALIEKLNGGPIGDVKFFHMTEIRRGASLQCPRRGLAGAIGLEIGARGTSATSSATPSSTKAESSASA